VTSRSTSPLSSSDADCVPARKGGRPVWISLETPGGSSSLPWSGTVRWTAAALEGNKPGVSVFVLCLHIELKTFFIIKIKANSREIT